MALVAGAIALYPTAVPADFSPAGIDADAVFGAESVAEAKDYERFLYALWVLAQVALVGTLWLYARRGSAFMNESSAGPIGTGMFLGMLGLGIAWLVGIPFRVAAHWWERRHGLSEVDYFSWVVGDWSELAAQFVAVSLALLVVMALARRLGERWWLPGAAVFVAIAALFTFTAPYLDFTTEPLDDEGLRAAGERYERELDLPSVPVRVEDVGDSQLANAYAYGIGPTRRVVFWDTMLEEPFDGAQQRFVLAHELAHHSQTHLPEGLAWFALFAVPGAWILMRATRRRGGMGTPEAVPLALLVVVLVQLAFAPAANLVSRRMEAEADWKALEVTRDPGSLEQVMVGFHKTSLGDPTPPGWVQLLIGTHPALADRVAMARAWAEQER